MKILYEEINFVLSKYEDRVLNFEYFNVKFM